MNNPREQFERILDSKLVDLNDQFLYHQQSGNIALSEIVEREAMTLCEAYENGETFLILKTPPLTQDYS
jgi:hypothetical protein